MDENGKKGPPKKAHFLSSCVSSLSFHIFSKYVHNTPVPTRASLTLIIPGLRITSDDKLFLFYFYMVFNNSLLFMSIVQF